MPNRARSLIVSSVLFLISDILFMTASIAQQPGFRGAPASAAETKNPYADNAAAAAAGKKLYGQNCAQCHGKNLEGMGPAPALDTPNVRQAKAGDLFWFITTGKMSSGMPSWSRLPTQQRWQIVSFLQASPEQKTAAK